MNCEVRVNEKLHRLELDYSEGRWRCQLDGKELNIDAVLTRPNVLSLLVDGKAYEIKRELTPGDLHLWVGSSRYSVEVSDSRSFRNRKGGTATNQGPQRLAAAMPGKVVRILLQEGARVEAGQGILVIEAMKMQNEIKSPKAGRIQRVMVNDGDALNAGDVVAVVE